MTDRQKNKQTYQQQMGIRAHREVPFPILLTSVMFLFLIYRCQRCLGGESWCKDGKLLETGTCAYTYGIVHHECSISRVLVLQRGMQ